MTLMNAYEVSNIVWYFYSQPEHAVDLVYQAGDWGRIAVMTDFRYYSDSGGGSWLWA